LIDGEQRLSALLTELGCSTPIEDLRTMKEARFRELGEKIASAGMSKAELF
jgi:hypothetical protein